MGPTRFPIVRARPNYATSPRACSSSPDIRLYGESACLLYGMGRTKSRVFSAGRRIFLEKLRRFSPLFHYLFRRRLLPCVKSARRDAGGYAAAGCSTFSFPPLVSRNKAFWAYGWRRRLERTGKLCYTYRGRGRRRRPAFRRRFSRTGGAQTVCASARSAFG